METPNGRTTPGALTVIGLGVGSDPGLSTEAIQSLEQADLVVGSKRQIESLPDLSAEVVHYPSPFSGLWTLLDTWAGKRVTLLGTGDPLLYGIGATLLQRLDPNRITFHPATSSIQVAFARIKRPWSEARIISLHGRPLSSLRAALGTQRLYGLLTDAGSHPLAIAELVTEAGYGASTVWVAEDLGTSCEQISSFRADTLPARAFSPLNVVILETRGQGGPLPEFPGIPDEHFSTDGEQLGAGMLSKRETRLAILSLLEPRHGETGWDVGAGCGGVAVEWARWNPGGRVFAVERVAERARHLDINRERFGVVRNLEILVASAPDALASLPDPDAVFLGGGGSQLPALLDCCWRRLQTGGRLVVSAVTENSRACLNEFAQSEDTELSQIAVSRATNIGERHLLRPLLPVLLLKRVKR